jgi:hypothetical protein
MGAFVLDAQGLDEVTFHTGANPEGFCTHGKTEPSPGSITELNLKSIA